MHTKKIWFQICAELVAENGVRPGTRGWLGDEIGFPHWSVCQSNAYQFVSTASAANYFNTTTFGGLYRPKANTVIIVERVVEETITELSCLLGAS
jgi:hypothetical protein